VTSNAITGSPDSPTEASPDFAAWVAARRPALLRAAVAITGDRDSAEDLVQTALAAVFPRWSTIRDHRAAEGYVRRAMVNQNVSWSRQRWRSTERSTADVPEPSERWVAMSLPRSAPAGTALWSLVSSLPPRQRSAVVLRYYEDLSEAETAEVLRVTVGTVKSSTSRALARLRDLTSDRDRESLAG